MTDNVAREDSMLLSARPCCCIAPILSFLVQTFIAIMDLKKCFIRMVRLSEQAKLAWAWAA